MKISQNRCECAIVYRSDKILKVTLPIYYVLLHLLSPIFFILLHIKAYCLQDNLYKVDGLEFMLSASN